MLKPFKTRPDEFNQRVLFPTNIFDLLPKEHGYYLYADILTYISHLHANLLILQEKIFCA